MISCDFMLTNYDVTAIIATCALLMSLIFWITLKKRWLPQLKTNIIDEAPAIGKKTYDLIKEDLPDLNELFKEELPGVIQAFKKELPDFKKIIEDVKADIKKEIPKIPTMDDIMDGVFINVIEKIKSKDEDFGNFINIISGIVVIKAIDFFETNEHIKHWQAGKVSSIVQAIKKEMPDFGPLIEKAKQYGIDIDGTGQGQLPSMDNVNIEDKLKMKFAFAADKFIDNWIAKIGTKV